MLAISFEVRFGFGIGSSSNLLIVGSRRCFCLMLLCMNIVVHLLFS